MQVHQTLLQILWFVFFPFQIISRIKNFDTDPFLMLPKSKVKDFIFYWK